MELWQLRYFVAVAETEHVGKAAAVLNISQSPLSHQIRQLERQLGVALFERVKKRVRLTSVGRNFLENAQELLAHAGAIERQVKQLAAGERGWIEIGYVEGAVHSGVLPEILRSLRQQRPHLEPRLHALRSAQQVAALAEGHLDVGFVHTPPTESGYIVRHLESEPMSLVIPADHALANCNKRICPVALDGAHFILLEERASPGFRERLMKACSDYGFQPNPAFNVRDIPTMLGLVSGGLGFSFAQASLARSAPAGVTFRLLPKFPLQVRTFLVAREAPAISPIVELMFSIAKEVQQIRMQGLRPFN